MSKRFLVGLLVGPIAATPANFKKEKNFMRNLRLGIVGFFATFSLMGTANADLVASTNVLMFGDVPLGSYGQQIVNVTNTSTRNVEGFTLTVSGNKTNTEFFTSECAPTQIPSNTCQIVVELNPLHYGNKKRTLSVSGYEILDDGSVQDVSVDITLVGTSDNPNKP